MGARKSLRTTIDHDADDVAEELWVWWKQGQMGVCSPRAIVAKGDGVLDERVEVVGPIEGVERGEAG